MDPGAEELRQDAAKQQIEAEPIKQQDFASPVPPSTANVAKLPGAKPEKVTESRRSSMLASPTGLHFDRHAQPVQTPGTWSVGSDRPANRGSATDPSDRVFPIRSVVQVDPHATSSIRQASDHDYFGRMASDSTVSAPRTAQHISERSENDGPRRTGSVAIDTRSPPSADTALSSAAPFPPNAEDMERRKRRHGMGGSRSAVQADAERYGSTVPIPIFSADHSDDESSNPDDAKQSRDFEDSMEGARSSASDTTPETLMTVRFKHVTTDEGHLVITGRDGTLQRCEDEPIHAPGAIQSFGALVVLKEEGEGIFHVRQASENTQRVLGYTPKELFRLANFTEVLTEEQSDNLMDHVDFIRDEDADPMISGPEVFSMSIKPPRKRTQKLWCAVHLHPSDSTLVICEFELDDDREYPMRPEDDRTPDEPEDTLQSNPTTEELYESTAITSKPLRVLRSARKQRGEAGAMQVFDIMSQVQDQLASAPNLDQFLKILVGIVKELTGFHRVMIYQFDASYNGKVVTELVDATQTKDLYKGLHFPASDIPKQARDLYRFNKVRLLYDRDAETSRMVCRSQDDLELPLDMTHAYLRAISPIHIKYLANMAVRSSMSISINAFGELWGLIACHSYGQRGMRVSFPIRKMCRLVGDSVSRNIERLSYASRLQARKLINTVPTDKNPSGYIIASSDDLLKLFDADFGMLSIKGETKIMGKIDQSQEALVMLEYLKMRKLTSVMASQDIAMDFPDLKYPPGFSFIAGLLYVPLSVGGNDFIVFFRKGQVREVKWAGNPYEKIVQEGTQAYLEPRKSFKVWHETVLGKCREWTQEQIETSAVLCLVYGKFIEVWRQKEAAIQSSRLTRLLLANSAHEVRTPLNAIINYLEIAMEGSLDQETRDNLSKSHSASKSLIYVINDLLDLTKTEEGQGLVKDEVFDFSACMKEATEPFRNDAKRKGIGYEIVERHGLPKYVYGDQRRLRQAVANVTANAVQHTAEGTVKIEAYTTEVDEQKVRIEIVIEDTGRGMSSDQLDALFRDLEQVSTDVEETSAPEDASEKSDGRGLGLGLAVVARIVKNMDGRLRLKSESGKGSRFVIELPFIMPKDDTPQTEGATPGAESGTGGISTASISTTKAVDQAGEVMLVDGNANAAGSSIMDEVAPSPKKSFDESSIASRRSIPNSLHSATSARSDADRLIDAIQTPLGIGEPEDAATGSKRRNSKNAYYGAAGGSLTRSPNASLRSLSPRRNVTRPELSRSKSSPPKDGLEIMQTDEPMGMEYVTDSKTPIRPVKVPDDYQDRPERPAQPSTQSRVLFELGGGAAAPADPDTADEQGTVDTATTADANVQAAPEPVTAKLRVLVAEDDPINMKLLRKRLEKAGHEVHHTVNGQDCASVHQEKSKDFDVVLMDMQMPIVDGLNSTKMIRSHERSSSHTGLSLMASNHGRIPIFAVSASLLEKDKDSYISAGFDGWILKPIDFKRLNTLLYGIIDDSTRNECVYKPGDWEKGGWFRKRLELKKEDKAREAPELRDAALKGNEVNAARESLERSQ